MLLLLEGHRGIIVWRHFSKHPEVPISWSPVYVQTSQYTMLLWLADQSSPMQQAYFLPQKHVMGQGSTSPSGFKDGKKDKIKYFNASNLLKLAFLSSLTWKYAVRASMTVLALRKASASGAALPPGPPTGGIVPWNPKVALPLWTIYTGTAPDLSNLSCYPTGCVEQVILVSQNASPSRIHTHDLGIMSSQLYCCSVNASI